MPKRIFREKMMYIIEIGVIIITNFDNKVTVAIKAKLMKISDAKL
jgi:hypothetical protein